MRYTKAIPVGLLAAVAAQCFLIPSCSSRSPQHARSIQAIRNTKMIIASYRGLCASGRLEEGGSPQGRYGDSRGPVLWIMLDKLRRHIGKEVLDPAKQAESLAVLDGTDVLLHDQIAPAYTQAMRSRRPDDAKALVPILDDLDRRMDEMLRILS